MTLISEAEEIRILRFFRKQVEVLGIKEEDEVAFLNSRYFLRKYALSYATPERFSLR